MKVKKSGSFKIVHNKKLFWVIIILMVLLGVLVYFIVREGGNSEEDMIAKCQVDSDCIPDSCCHATGCVNQENKPNCNRVFCTAVCQGPLDCNAGYCGCVDGACGVVSTR